LVTDPAVNLAQGISALLMVAAGAITAMIIAPDFALPAGLGGLVLGTVAGCFVSDALMACTVRPRTTVSDPHHEKKFNRAWDRYARSFFLMLGIFCGIEFFLDRMDHLQPGAWDGISSIYFTLLGGSILWFIICGRILWNWKCPRCHKPFRRYPCPHCHLDRYWIP
jgi:hypothetical protein